jgi:integrase
MPRTCRCFRISSGPLRGQRRKNYVKAWRRACAAAGVPDLLKHDLRRSAVRNLVRSGISEHTAMKITGHRTRSVFDRYDIIGEQDLIDAAAKLAAFQTAAAGHISGHTAHKIG